ncbi:class I SAM-dependent methyltransferase [Bdellovibrio bacteriovorus]|uniref:class I SAM-dependent methyltransferase n=1 Tax=Bdellovibrio TaxID=958 RepID=UPI0035A88ADA
MVNQQKTVPDHTAVRVALWRAMHAQIDSSPHVMEDVVGLQLISPDESWKSRPDMHPQGTRGYRASIVGRARFIEDLVLEQMNHGVDQYVILGAGIDTFVQRRPEVAAKLRVFEIDQPATQEWKRQRLIETGLGIAKNLSLVPVDFEAGESWRKKLKASGFDESKPAIVASAGVSMYLTREANKAAMAEVAQLAPGSTLVMTFILPLDLLDPEDRPQHEMIYERAKAAGTPFISFFRPNEAIALAREAGFKEAKHVSRADIIQRYFTGRPDGLQPSSGEEYLVATT